MIPVLIVFAALGVLAFVINQSLAWRKLNALRAALRETAGTRPRDLENSHPSAHRGRLVLLLDYRAVLESANQYRRITEAQKTHNARMVAQIDRQVIRLKRPPPAESKPGWQPNMPTMPPPHNLTQEQFP